MAEVEITDHSDEVKDEMKAAIERALEKCGLVAEGYAKRLTPVDTGNLRNSITHTTDEDTAYIGTNVEYAPYQELGFTSRSGKFVPGANGGRGYLRPAVQDHKNEYVDIFLDEFG